MSLHDHITNTDYDIEIMLGEDYFLNIFQGLYENNIIPNEIKFNNIISIKVNKPKNISIVTDSVVPIYYSSFVPDIILTLPVRILTKTLQTRIGFSVSITNKEIIFKFLSLDIETEEFINSKAEELQISNLLILVKEELKKYLNKNIPLSFANNIISELTYKKLTDDGLYKKAFGLYINLNLNLDFEPFIIPYTNQPYIPEFITRKNDLSKAKSFLPRNKSFAIWLSDNTFRRIELNLWNSLAEVKNSQKSFPFYKKDFFSDKKSKVGHYQSVSLKLNKNKLTLEVRLKITATTPDAEVKVKIDITPMIVQSQVIFDTKFKKLDIDTGIFFNIATFFLGSLLGIGGILGNFIIELTERNQEDKFAKKLSGLLNSLDISKTFLSFPSKMTLAKKCDDPFYYNNIDNINLFHEIETDAKGMSIIGFNTVEPVPTPFEVKITNKTENSSGELEAIEYETPYSGKQSLSIENIFQRIKENKLSKVKLEPSHIKRKKTVVTHIKFSNGVDFKVSDLAKLQLEKVIFVKNYALIAAHKKSLHYRALADSTKENNLESLPEY